MNRFEIKMTQATFKTTTTARVMWKRNQRRKKNISYNNTI